MNQSGGAVQRGQLVVITALLLVVLFVGLALVLNSAIYTESISSRSTDDSDAALSAASMTFGTIDTLLVRVNSNHNGSYANLTRNYTELATGLQDTRESEYAKQGTSFNITTINQTNGTHLRQTNQTRTFTNASGDASDWQVAGGVDGISDYEIVVNREDLYTDDGSSDLLSNSSTVHLTDESGTVWELHIYESMDGNVTIKPVVDGTEKSACEVDAAEVKINLVAGTVGGKSCSSLVFAEGLAGTVDIEYHNPDKIGGTYSLRVDVTIDPATNDHYVEPGSGSPTATPNIYATTTRVRLAGSDVSFTSTQRIVAGEPAYAE